MPLEHILWLSQISRADESLVGAKAADLGEMTTLKLPVPNGFVVATSAYYSFLQSTGLRTKLEALLAHVDTSDANKLHELSRQAQALVQKAVMPDEIKRDITSAYHHLSAKDVFVAIRASLPDSESTDTSLAQQAKLNIGGAKAVLEAVQTMWASQFSSRSLYVRAEHGTSQLSSGMAVIVQRMVESEVSGILFTVDPMANANTVSIEAIWGLGEPMITGDITPDHYEVTRADWSISRKDIVRQEWQLVRQEAKSKPGIDNNLKLPVSTAWQRKQKLADEHIITLAKLAVTVEEHYGYPQDCEWAYANKQFYLVQTRPIAPLQLPDQSLPLVSTDPYAATPLLQGLAASPGMATGPVKLVRSSQDLAKIKKGDIVVCQATNPGFDQTLPMASGLVTMNGGLASHAAAMARQFAIPAVVEAGDVASLLHTGEIVTVDGYSGAVYPGEVHISANRVVVSQANAKARQAHPEKGMTVGSALPFTTATKIMVNITEPDMAEEIAQKQVDGVGLLRAEYMISHLGEHPQHLLYKDKGEALVSTLYDGLMTVAKAFNPRPVLYRASDFTSREFSRLLGGEQFELTETNPLLGYRGAHRFISDSSAFKLELAAIRKARAYYKNIWLMVPFVRTPEELVQVKQLLAEEGLYRSSSFKLYLMVEVPSTVFLLDQFLGVGVDGVSLGTNDLTQLIMGVDRDNPRVAPLFDERNEAVMMAMERVVRGAAKHGIDSSVCGQAPAMYPEIASKLVSWGVSSISVSPESAEATRRLVAEAELAAVRQGRIKK